MIQLTQTLILISIYWLIDDDHFGLDEAKKRILEFIAVGKLNNSIQGKILCLHGPPGVGKTSFAFSVARALSRKVARISLGGESNPNSLKGHRKTYVAAGPGRIVEALRDCQTENCVIILDEIDKLSNGAMGDPRSTLLEILDPEQNASFNDNYMEFPIDLSKVFFICTANDIRPISPPLRDRMDMIELTSYTTNEKKRIFYDHLLPASLEETGLGQHVDQFELKDEIVEHLIEAYSRESGVRSLKKNINKILEKIAFRIVENKHPNEKIVVSLDNIIDFLGLPVFDKDSVYKGKLDLVWKASLNLFRLYCLIFLDKNRLIQIAPGVIFGLAYSTIGGSVLMVEASLASIRRGSQGIKYSGNLGKVMKESMSIAYSFARNFLGKLENNFLEQ